jgi:predicted dehydrogenase
VAHEHDVRVGIIGAGYIGDRHATNLLGFDDVDVVAVADVAGARAETLAARCDAHAYDDWEAMLRRERMDALYICVPPFAHGAPEHGAIDMGLPFLVEKPLAVDLATADDIARRVEQQGLLTSTGYHWRYLDVVERARDVLAERQVRLALGYWLDLTPDPAWWRQERQSGGQMVEQTTHIFDLARLLVGEVVTVSGTGCRTPRPSFPLADISDASVAVIGFAGGGIGAIASTCLLDWPHRIGLHLYAEGIVVEVSERDIVVEDRNGRSTYDTTVDAIALEDRDFIDAVQGKTACVRAPYEEALRTHRVAVAAARAAREAAVVSLGVEVAHD